MLGARWKTCGGLIHHCEMEIKVEIQEVSVLGHYRDGHGSNAMRHSSTPTFGSGGACLIQGRPKKSFQEALRQWDRSIENCNGNSTKENTLRVKAV